MPDIISRDDSRAAGKKRFFTGVPCKQGHMAERNVNTGKCCVCVQAVTKAWAKANPEKMREHGRRSEAKHIEKRRAKDRRVKAAWRAAHPEENKRRLKHWRATHLDAAKAKQKEWRDAHKAEAAANQRAWRLQNVERQKKTKKRWIENNLERWKLVSRAKDFRRRALKAAAEGHHTAEDIKLLLERQGYKCVNCRKSLRKGFDADHIMPLSKGGANWPSNLQLLCASCNRKKHDKDPIVWAQQHGRLL